MADQSDELNKRIDKFITEGEKLVALYQKTGNNLSPYYSNDTLTRGMRRKQHKSTSYTPLLKPSLSAFTEWQSQVLNFLNDLLGTEHIYSEKFKESVIYNTKSCVENGIGVLLALKKDNLQGHLKHKTLSKNKREPEEGMIEPIPPEFLQKLLWIKRHGRKHWKIIVLAIIIIVASWFLFPYIKNLIRPNVNQTTQAPLKIHKPQLNLIGDVINQPNKGKRDTYD